MNSVRSPAPGGALFNLPKNNKNILSAANTVASNILNTTPKQSANIVYVILLSLLVILIISYIVFWKSINETLYDYYEFMRKMLGANKNDPVNRKINDDENMILNKPEAPQNSMNNEKDFIEKVLPGHKETFNISKNHYTYYDAEPLCKALNAELATYEQVKQAYANGADWCNYGWVKGQMAVYPTQKSTWDTLQSGPENERMSCGSPGVNGGFFDNPELKFGVNCYGVKPEQKDHDATAIASGEGAPLSPEQLKQEKKIAKYRGELNYISVLPWNNSSWSG